MIFSTFAPHAIPPRPAGNLGHRTAEAGMRGSIRWRVGIAAAVAVTCVLFALSATAQFQQPDLLPPGVTRPIPDPMPGPPAVEDPEVMPAQFVQPGGVEGRPGTVTRAVADPPAP